MTQTEKIKLTINSLLISENEVLNIFENSIDCNNGRLITYFNQNSFNEYYSNKEFREVLQSKFEIFCDGKGMAFALKFLFAKKVDKFNATDLYMKMFDRLFNEKIPVYIIGGNFDEKDIIARTKNKVILAGYTNGYLGIRNVDSVITNIKNSDARIIGIGMGTPLQEIFASNISLELNNCIILCCGNFFNFHFGFSKRAPKYLINSGFEWMHRLILEPRKLWKRYIIGIPKFVFRVLIIKFS